MSNYYDTEATGLILKYDQILQIALVFVDDDMNILSVKKLQCRRSPWVVPSPAAMFITGFSPDDLKFNKMSSYEMMKEVHAWAREQAWPTEFAGYNTFFFDEEILAQNSYQNLLDPGLTTATNEINGQRNIRNDVMIAVKAVALYMPGVLTLEVKNDYGSPSMALKHVAQQNGVELSEEEAHDALNDIKATIGVARVIKKGAPQIWEHLRSLATVEGADAFLKANEIFTYAAKRDQAVVAAYLGEKPGSTVGLLYDLGMDPEPYINMSAQELKALYYTKGAPRPFHFSDKATQPIWMPMDQSAAVVSESYDPAVAEARAKLVKEHPTFAQNVAKAAAMIQKTEAMKTPEDMIRKEIEAGIKARIDAWISEFHAATDDGDWQAAAKLSADFRTRFADDLVTDPSISRFAKFATRIIFEHAPEELSEEKQEKMKRHIASRVLDQDPKAPYTTIAKARKDLEVIEKERAEGKAKWAGVTDGQIRALKLYYTAIEKEYLPYAPPSAPVSANDNVAPPKVIPLFKKNPEGPKS